MKHAIFAVLFLSVLGLVGTSAEAAGITVQKIRGDLTAIEEGSAAAGRFALLAITSGGTGRENLVVFAEGLDTTKTYEVRLGDDAGTTSFGEMTFRGTKGYAFFRFSSYRDGYPGVVQSLAEFNGKSIFVTLDGAAVLTGTIGSYVEPGTGGDPADNSFAIGMGYEKILPPEGSETRAGGLVTAVAVNSAGGSRERIGFLVLGLEYGVEHGVFLTGATEDKLGTITPRGWFGIGRLALDTQRGDTLPGHLGSLAGRGIEVRDADGNVVLSGVFPSLK